MKKTLAIFLLSTTFANANPIDDQCPQHTIFGAPISSITENTQYVCHGNYAIHYRYDTKTAEYVVEHLDATDISGPAKRKDDFRPDPLIPDELEASLADYKGSGYDRGHLVPAADNRTDKEQMSESFYLSNMIPQNPNHNRGIWRILELGVRNTGLVNDVYAVSGTIYDEGYTVIGNGLGVPSRVWKVVYNVNTNEAIGFLFPNEKIAVKDLPKYVVTVDAVEEATGLNIFPQLDEAIESVVKIDVATWPSFKLDPDDKDE